MCYGDYDPPDFIDQSTVTARKPHTCYECGKPIAKGEKYERTSGKWWGEISRFTICMACVGLRSEVVAHELAEGCLMREAVPPFGYLLEAVREMEAAK